MASARWCNHQETGSVCASLQSDHRAWDLTTPQGSGVEGRQKAQRENPRRLHGGSTIWLESQCLGENLSSEQEERKIPSWRNSLHWSLEVKVLSCFGNHMQCYWSWLPDDGWVGQDIGREEEVARRRWGRSQWVLRPCSAGGLVQMMMGSPQGRRGLQELGHWVSGLGWPRGCVCDRTKVGCKQERRVMGPVMGLPCWSRQGRMRTLRLNSWGESRWQDEHMWWGW